MYKNLVSLLGFCTHKILLFSSNPVLDVKGRFAYDEKGLRCEHCGKFFPYKKEFTVATGVFARIDKRIEDEKELQEVWDKVKIYAPEFANAEA